ncbi:MAG: energy transducer TonB [Candidatus Delongbacteria bacterium]
MNTHWKSILLPGLVGLATLGLGAVQAGEKECVPLLEAPGPVGGPQALAAALTYPPTALREGLEGEVRLQVEIGADGRVGEVLVLQTARADLDSAAVHAVRDCPWVAGRSAEGPQPCTVVVPVNFRLAPKP